MVRTYWSGDSTSAVYQQPPFFSRMRRMLSHSAPASESVKYISRPSVVTHTLPSTSSSAFPRDA